MKQHTPEQIAEAVANISSYTDEALVTHLKIISSMSSKKDKELYKPMFKAIEQERRSRGNVTVTAKVDGIKKPNVEWED